MRRGAHTKAGDGLKERLVVAAAAEEAYAMPLAVMLRSAAESLGEAFGLDAYVVSDGLSEATRARVEASLPKTARVGWVMRSANEFEGLPRWGRISLGTYHKITLGSWLPSHVDRVIWLDCDTLVVADLSTLWTERFLGKTVSAARDHVVPRIGSAFGVAGWREMGLSPRSLYFNAGVMVIDVERWRRTEVERRCFEYLDRFGPRVWFWDQEALNAVLTDQWEPLDVTWNFPARGFPAVGGTAGAHSPRIVHFTGNLKPWRVAGKGALFTAYEHRIDQTAWAGARPKRSWLQWLLAAYAQSPLRTALLPVEALHMRWIRWSTIEAQRPLKHSS